jgi:hypothetical protein
MAKKPGTAKRGPFTAADRKLLAILGDHNLVQRGILCTFARVGTAWRRAEPERTRAWLEQLDPHPFYKGGQFLFDLLEVEDFMLDGPAPPIVSQAELVDIARRVVEWTGIEVPVVAIAVALEALPELEPGFYLYRDVVLGLVYVLASGVDRVG